MTCIHVHEVPEISGERRIDLLDPSISKIDAKEVRTVADPARPVRGTDVTRTEAPSGLTAMGSVSDALKGSSKLVSTSPLASEKIPIRSRVLDAGLWNTSASLVESGIHAMATGTILGS